MFTQNQFFKTLSLTVLFFFVRTLTAVAPHKTGAQITGDASTTDAFWAGFGVTCIAIVAGVAYWIVQSEKSTRYDN